MSSRAVRKRRHRHDFDQYMEQKKTGNKTGPLWKRMGFQDEETFRIALNQSQVVSEPEAVQEEHIHGPDCQH